MMRSLVWTLIVVGGFYVAICAYYYLLQDRFVFYGAAPVAPDVPTHDVAFAVPGAMLAGAIVNPDAPIDVVYFGGNAESVMHAARRFAAIAGARTLLVDYRGYGRSSGTASQSAVVDDAVTCVRSFRSGRGGPLVVVGRSLGSGVAALATARLEREVDAIVLISPFTSLTRVAAAHFPWLPVRWLLRSEFDVAAIASALPPRISIVIASDDRIIPASLSHELAAALAASRPSIIELAGIGHDDLLAREETWQAIAQVVAAVAPPRL